MVGGSGSGDAVPEARLEAIERRFLAGPRAARALAAAEADRRMSAARGLRAARTSARIAAVESTAVRAVAARGRAPRTAAARALAQPVVAPADARLARRRIFEAARAEFADKGLAGARIEVIAAAARSNKRMIYYYFESKEALYLAVLEDTYIDMRREEAALELQAKDPVAAIRELVRFKFDYCEAHPHLIGLLVGENLLGARHLRQSSRLLELHVSLVETIRGLLKRGARAGQFRRQVDPLELYISIAALSYFYFSNRATLATAFGQPLDTPVAQARRREHAVDVILGYLRP